ncbi:MAG: hypothetical protein WCZ90_09825 [Melioribacteraceae bacterium]
MIGRELHIVIEFAFALGWLLGIISSITNEKISRLLHSSVSKLGRKETEKNQLNYSSVTQVTDAVARRYSNNNVCFDLGKATELELIIDNIIKTSLSPSVNSYESYLKVLSNYTDNSDCTSCRCFIYVENFKDYLKVSQIIFLNLTLALKKLLELTQLSINTTFHYYITSTRNLLQNFFLIVSNKGFYTNLHIHDLKLNNGFGNYSFNQYLWKDYEKLLPNKN